MVRDVIIEPAINGFFVTIFYKVVQPDGDNATKVYCRSTAQINALLKDLFPKEKKTA